MKIEMNDNAGFACLVVAMCIMGTIIIGIGVYSAGKVEQKKMDVEQRNIELQILQYKASNEYEY